MQRVARGCCTQRSSVIFASNGNPISNTGTDNRCRRPQADAWAVETHRVADSSTRQVHVFLAKPHATESRATAPAARRPQGLLWRGPASGTRALRLPPLDTATQRTRLRRSFRAREPSRMELSGELPKQSLSKGELHI